MPALLGILQRIVHDADTAEDLLQEVFIKIWQQGHRHDPAQGRLFTWLITLTRRIAFDYLRAQKSSCLRYVDELPSHPSFSVTPTYAHIGVQDQLEVVLDEKHRQLIYLVYWQGYTHKAIADKLGLPIGTVKTRLRTALQYLRRSLASENQTKLPMVYTNELITSHP